MRITFIIATRASCTENGNLDPSEIAHFLKSAKMYTCENIYVHSIYIFLLRLTDPIKFHM